MKTLKITGKDHEGNLQPFVILNPTNVVVNTGVVQKPGTLTDAAGEPIPVTEIKTFVHIAGTPIICEETVDEILKQAEAI